MFRLITNACHRLFFQQGSSTDADHIESIDQASAHWNNWQKDRNSSDRKWNDWGEHPTVLRLIYRQLFGDPDCTVFHYLRREYPGFAQASVLSLCSGDGSFERQLIDNDIFAHVTGIDVAEERVATAKELHKNSSERLQFLVGDVNRGDFGENLYDVVFAKAALHHIENLEALFAGIRRCLKPGGRLVTIDFFGPARFQWTDVQLRHANELLLMVPEKLRKGPDASVINEIKRPTIEEMIEADPSEAVRSSEIYDFIQANFNIEQDFPIGGTLLNLILTMNTVNNFAVDENCDRVIRQLFDAERELIERKELTSDFKFIVASMVNEIR